MHEADLLIPLLAIGACASCVCAWLSPSTPQPWSSIQPKPKPQPPSPLIQPTHPPTQNNPPKQRIMPPKYPVVDPAPTLDTVTANFGAGEYGLWLGVTGLSVPLGHFAGKRGVGGWVGGWVGKGRGG